jgi:hypothetical protein
MVMKKKNEKRWKDEERVEGWKFDDLNVEKEKESRELWCSRKNLRSGSH